MKGSRLVNIYSNETRVHQDKLDVVIDGFYELVKKELPKEAQSVQVIKSILEDISSDLEAKQLAL